MGIGKSPGVLKVTLVDANLAAKLGDRHRMAMTAIGRVGHQPVVPAKGRWMISWRLINHGYRNATGACASARHPKARPMRRCWPAIAEGETSDSARRRL